MITRPLSHPPGFNASGTDEASAGQYARLEDVEEFERKLNAAVAVNPRAAESAMEAVYAEEVRSWARGGLRLGSGHRRGNHGEAAEAGRGLLRVLWLTADRAHLQRVRRTEAGVKARLMEIVRSIAFGPPAGNGLTPTQARVLYSARAQAVEWGKLWRFTGLYPETHRDGGRAEVARPRGAIAR